MRSALVCGWLLIPAAMTAYHYGPGQERLVLDDAEAQLQTARHQASAGNWSAAAEAYDAALALIPGDRVDAARRARLERAKCQMFASRLPEAYDDLTALVDELTADSAAPQPLVDEARGALASAQYYLTWLLRLEGQGRDVWEPEIEASRQNYRLLADAEQKRGNKTANREQRENLEAAIRLARLDLAELQALPLPKQCNGCCSGNCKCKGKGRTPKEKQGENDARGASSGPPPDNRGS